MECCAPEFLNHGGKQAEMIVIVRVSYGGVAGVQVTRGALGAPRLKLFLNSSYSLDYSAGLASSQFLPLQCVIMEKVKLEEKLAELRRQLHHLETVEMERITHKRIEADMGDDFRENEGAKLVMEDHNMLHLRVLRLKEEIYLTKKRIFFLKHHSKG